MLWLSAEKCLGKKPLNTKAGNAASVDITDAQMRLSFITQIQLLKSSVYQEKGIQEAGRR